MNGPSPRYPRVHRRRLRPGWRRWTLVLVGGAVIGALLGSGIAALTPAQYRATATVVVGPLDTVDPKLAEVKAAIELAPSLAALMTRGPRLEALAEELGLPMSADELDRNVYSQAARDRPIITITALAPTGATAAAIANRLAEMAIEVSASADQPEARARLADPAATTQEPAWPIPVRYAIGGALVTVVLGWVLFLRTSELPVARSARARPVPRGFILGGLLSIALLAAMAIGAPELIFALLGGSALVLAIASPLSALPILLAILPFPELDAFEPIGLSYLLVGALAAGTIAHLAADRRWPSLSVPLVLLAAFGAIVAFDAVPAVNGLDGAAARDAVSRVLNVAAGVVTFLVVASILRDVRLGPYLAVAVGATAIAAAVAVIHAVSGGLGPLSTQHLIAEADQSVVARATGPFANPNYAGAFMAAGLVLAMNLLRNRGELRILALVAVAPIAAALLLSFSRGALVAAGVGLVVSIWLANRRAAVVVAVAAVVVAVAVYPFVLQTRYERGGGFATVRAVERVQESDEMRLEASLSSFELWAVEPIMGIGGGQFPYKSPRILEESTVSYPHNEYLAVLAEHGIVGASLLAAALAAVLVRVQRASGYIRPVALAVVTTLAVSAAFTQPLGSFQVLGIGWVLLGMASSRAASGPGSRSSLLRWVRA